MTHRGKSSRDERPKLPAAVEMGNLAGKANMEKYGVDKFKKMASLGWKTTQRKYGHDGYVLMRYGFKPALMTRNGQEPGSPEWEKALADIEAGKVPRKRKRTKAEMEIERTRRANEKSLLISHGYKPDHMTAEQQGSALEECRTSRWQKLPAE